jgi:cytochrome c-type biogenesis protein
MEIPFALAFTAGLVATINPCGFAMLPAYLSYFVGLEDGTTEAPAPNLARALLIGGVVSAGFLAVFGAFGILVTLGLRVVIEALPWAAMVVGVGVAGLGVAMLSGLEPRFSLPTVGVARPGRRLPGVFLFGVSYAIASLSCTLPVFLVVVAGAIPQLGFLPGVVTFLIYGLGMSTLLLVVTLALALGKHALVGRLRRTGRHVNRIAGAILVVAGTYIVVFWVTTLAGDGTTQPAAVVQVELFSAHVTNWVRERPGVIAGAAGALIGLAALWAARPLSAARVARRPRARR